MPMPLAEDDSNAANDPERCVDGVMSMQHARTYDPPCASTLTPDPERSAAQTPAACLYPNMIHPALHHERFALRCHTHYPGWSVAQTPDARLTAQRGQSM